MTFENPVSWEPGSQMNDPTNLLPEIALGVPLIKVLGVGGGGSNAVSRMYQDRLPVVEYWALNTDTQHLYHCDVGHRIPLGQKLIGGRGAGGKPDVGRLAAEESHAEIQQAIS
jgi:cell division protein FtsZ